MGEGREEGRGGGGLPSVVSRVFISKLVICIRVKTRSTAPPPRSGNMYRTCSLRFKRSSAKEELLSRNETNVSHCAAVGIDIICSR
jgi:hypothetical protein